MSHILVGLLFLPVSKKALSLYFREFWCLFLIPVIFFCGLFVKMTSFPLLRNLDVFFTCEYIFTGHFPTCNYIVDSFTCEEDIISVLEEF